MVARVNLCSDQHIVENNFYEIIKGLQVKPESLELMMQLATNTTAIPHEADFEQQRTEAIALCQRRIDVAVNLYGDGRLAREEYLRRVGQNEREIASWQTRTTETEKLSVQLVMCVQTIENINRLWEVAEDEDKQGMARHLFERIVFDLDKQCIVDFSLKPWAAVLGFKSGTTSKRG